MSHNPFSSGFRLPSCPSSFGVISGRRCRGGRGRLAPVPRLRRNQILIIEDDLEMITAIEMIKTKHHWPIQTAVSSGDAISRLSQQTFDTLILDWNLPDFQGDGLIRLTDSL